MVSQSVTAHNPEIEDGHFVSAQRYENEWLWYDGMQLPKLDPGHKRIRKMTPDGIHQYILQYLVLLFNR